MQPVSWGLAARSRDLVPNHLKHMLQDPAKERFFLIEISIEHAVGQTCVPADRCHRDRSVPIARKELDGRVDESLFGFNEDRFVHIGTINLTNSQYKEKMIRIRTF